MSERCSSMTNLMRAFVSAWYEAHNARAAAARATAVAKAETIATKMSPEERERVRAFIGLTRRAA